MLNIKQHTGEVKDMTAQELAQKAWEIIGPSLDRETCKGKGEIEITVED